MTVNTEELRSLVDWEHGLMSPRVYYDQEIYDAEMTLLFGRAWLFLAHESMIPNPGDFFSSYMGADPVLVVRQGDGSVRALLNACRHRGMQVCRAECGNIKALTCTYHGWTYDIAGNLVNVPNFEDGYYSALDVENWGLVNVAQVDSYKGLIFGNFDPTAPPLIEYLGDMAWYLDGRLDRRDGGTEVAPFMQKITYQGNWKLAAEQFTSDDYHVGVTHASVFTAIRQAGNPPRSVRPLEDGRQYSSRLGHGLTGFQVKGDEMLSSSFRTRGNVELADDFDEALPGIRERLGPDRPMQTGAANVFPNFSWSTDSILVWQPKGPHRVEQWRWSLRDKNESEEVKRLRVTANTIQRSIFDGDDGENFSQIERNLSSPQVRSLMFNYQMGLGQEHTDDPIYPGQISNRAISEAGHRSFYRRWLEFMTTGDRWPAVD